MANNSTTSNSSGSDAITAFRASVPQRIVADLHQRLQHARLPEKETVGDWSQGAPLSNVQALVAYWSQRYDMQRMAKRLNEFAQFHTQIDGLGIHFIHVRSPHPNAMPLILTHGWPGSVVEFLDVIGPLTDPTVHGGRGEDAFHVVIPSLPGFGFSEKPKTKGWKLPRIAKAWSTLMLRLGYDRYAAQGGDWGAGVTTWMAKEKVPGLAGIHLNLPVLFPPPLEGELSSDEKAPLAQLVAYGADKAGYAVLQASRPQTIGYALADSPVGQASWVYEKFGEWSDSDHQPDKVLSMDRMLDNIMLYWATDSAASSARLYAESFFSDFSPQKLDVPVAVSVFPGELFQAPRVWGDRMYSNIIYWGHPARGGHFAAFEQPAIFAQEVRNGLRPLRS